MQSPAMAHNDKSLFKSKLNSEFHRTLLKSIVCENHFIPMQSNNEKDYHLGNYLVLPTQSGKWQNWLNLIYILITCKTIKIAEIAPSNFKPLIYAVKMGLKFEGIEILYKCKADSQPQKTEDVCVNLMQKGTWFFLLYSALFPWCLL